MTPLKTVDLGSGPRGFSASSLLLAVCSLGRPNTGDIDAARTDRKNSERLIVIC